MSLCARDFEILFSSVVVTCVECRINEATTTGWLCDETKLSKLPVLSAEGTFPKYLVHIYIASERDF